MVDIVRGYEDPPGVMNLRSVKVDADDPPEAKMPGELRFGLDNGGEKAAVPRHSRLQTTRAVTLSVRQIKGSHVEQFARDLNAAMASLKGVLPEDLRIEWTHNEPKDVREKIRQFDQNLIEAVVIVVIVALLFMEWRSALLVAISIPLTVAMTLGFCHLLGIDLQQVSIGAMIIALGLLVDDPVVAGDAINREIAHGSPRDVAAWLGPQKLARAITYADGHQLRGLFAAAFRPREDGRLHLFAAGRGHNLARCQSHRVDDVHAVARLLCAARSKRI